VHFHRLEKIWLGFGLSMLVLFLLILGVLGFAMGMSPPSVNHHSIDPTKVNETPPFDQPGLKQIGDKEYEAVMTAFVFGYNPGNMEVPVGSTVHFTVTSPDVVHGFEIPGTNVNMMVVPGEVSHVSYKFDKPGEYLILCNEYCGIGHEMMKTTLVVK
jgi:cytochrome c oxidase subunit 2